MISALIIAKNEASHIERCIASLIGVADEILLLDTGSEDETVALGEKAGASVHRTAWQGYAATKNYGHTLVQYPYILSIDADEALSESLRTAILSQKPHLTGAYQMARKNYYCGKWIRFCGWYPDLKVRLYPKEKASWEGAYVHEQLVLDKEVTVHRLLGDLLHDSIASQADHVARAQTYAALAAEGMHARGKRFSYLKLWLSPLARFVRMYILQLGILDGIAGWRVCLVSAKAVAWRYRALRRSRSKVQ